MELKIYTIPQKWGLSIFSMNNFNKLLNFFREKILFKNKNSIIINTSKLKKFLYINNINFFITGGYIFIFENDSIIRISLSSLSLYRYNRYENPQIIFNKNKDLVVLSQNLKIKNE